MSTPTRKHVGGFMLRFDAVVPMVDSTCSMCGRGIDTKAVCITPMVTASNMFLFCVPCVRAMAKAEASEPAEAAPTPERLTPLGPDELAGGMGR